MGVRSKDERSVTPYRVDPNRNGSESVLTEFAERLRSLPADIQYIPSKDAHLQALRILSSFRCPLRDIW